MHIVIPMSGVGQRFIDAGFKDPKPLIEIDGKTIIQHVVELFPGESKFTFICNQTHLDSTNMREVLLTIAPQANVACIDNHKKGPVFAVTNILDAIDDDEEVIVNYCDFGTWWDYKDFLKHTRDRDADGAIPAYKRFHPHMLGSTNYAFMRDEKQWMLEIKEKEPFTDNRLNEYASNGTYYFKKGSYLKKYFPLLMEKDINLNGEYYVSLIYNLLVQDGLTVSIFDIEHMLQWGTPQDVAEYNVWSEYFKKVIQPQAPWQPEKNSTTQIPLAGHGSRFAKEGYTDPKPLLDVSGKAMILQANNQLPKSEHNAYVCLQDHVDRYGVDKAIKHVQPEAHIKVINQVTEGQAITCELGMDNIPDDSPLLIAACDNGMLWNHTQYQALIDNPEIDAIVWTFKGHPGARENPQMYGWVNTTHGGNMIKATGVSVKKAISDTPENDHAIVGTFYFRQSKMFKQALQKLKIDNIRVNGEFYVDSLMGVLMDMDFKVAAFEVDAYIGWGTPNDYETFKYWQSYFHKTQDHPYTIEQDPTVNSEKYSQLCAAFYQFQQEHR
ncbi:MAG: NTP transferase domain-containing protein [Colwellia sp.]